MPKITNIVAREILNSRGTPTIETSVLLDSGAYGTASSPSGASTGKLEAIELRDNDTNRYHGLGVLKAVQNVNETIASKLIGQEADDQSKIDKILIELDGTPNKARLGANATLSVSIATIKAVSNHYGEPLFQFLHTKYRGDERINIPGPTFNIINGGKHGAGNLDFQEFHIVPSTRFSFSQSLQIAVETYENLKAELIHRNAIHSIGDEGGFAPDLFTNTDALELLVLVIKNSPYKLHQDIFLGLDIAADTFYKNNKYHIKDSPKDLDRNEMIQFLVGMLKDYNLFSLEDPLDQESWDAWAELKTKIPENVLLVGDDLLTTNPDRLITAVKKKACNTILVKPNQIGTVSETINVMNIARQNGIYTIVSHRSGETNDDFIADFSVGLGANYTKFGAPVRGERVEKYNRLLEIELYLRTASQ